MAIPNIANFDHGTHEHIPINVWQGSLSVVNPLQLFPTLRTRQERQAFIGVLRLRHANCQLPTRTMHPAWSKNTRFKHMNTAKKLSYRIKSPRATLVQGSLSTELWPPIPHTARKNYRIVPPIESVDHTSGCFDISRIEESSNKNICLDHLREWFLQRRLINSGVSQQSLQFVSVVVLRSSEMRLMMMMIFSLSKISTVAHSSFPPKLRSWCGEARGLCGWFLSEIWSKLKIFRWH